MKHILYCRKSTDTEDKQVLSLESQQKELTDLAKAQDIEIVAIGKFSSEMQLSLLMI